MRAFPNATERNPVTLCKKLRRIETAISKPILDYCNGDNGMTAEKLEVQTDKALRRVHALLGTINSFCAPESIFINRDPRGHALKIDDAWTRFYNETQYAAKLPALHSDMGGYGIIAPDLNQ